MFGWLVRIEKAWSVPTNRIILVRGIRSFVQGYLNIITPLYLLSLGVSATDLGILYTLSFVVGAMLTVPVGVYADKWGRKPFLIAFTVLMLLWGIAYSQTTYLPILFVISIVSGIGRGGGDMGAGAPGPFGPAEIAMLADLSGDKGRHKVFSWNAIISSIFAAAGGGAAAMPASLHHSWVPFFSSNRGLFVFSVIAAILSLLALLSISEPPRQARKLGRRGPVSRKSAGLIVKQSLAGAFNAVGIGFINSLFVVWLHLRFGVGQAAIGPVFAVSYLLSAATVWSASLFAARFGSVKTIVISRFIAAALMAAVALSPTFLIAVVLQIFRISVTMMVAPVRQSFMMSLFPSDERASAAGLSGVVRRFAGAASPPVTGALFEAGYLEVPFLLGAVFQVLSGLVYQYYFGHMNDPSPRFPDRLPGGGEV